MKSILTGVVGIALGALLFSVPMVGAAGGDGTGPDGTRPRTGFVDKDGDGVCDRYQSGKGQGYMMSGQRHGGMGSGFVDADGDGVCDRYEEVKGWRRMMYHNQRHDAMGSGFVDADGDGVCDYYQDGKGQGRMMPGQRYGCKGPRFVDADGNGICDYHPDNAKTEKGGTTETDVK